MRIASRPWVPGATRALTYAAEPIGHAATGDYLLLEVADNGHGMDARTQAEIFKAFYTTKESGRRSYKSESACRDQIRRLSLPNIAARYARPN